MAFPSVAAVSTPSAEDALASSHTVNLPTGITAGDTLLIFFVDKDTDGSAQASASGWSIPTNGEAIQAGGSSCRVTVLMKKATGSEGSTETVTTDATTRSVHIAFRITGAADPTVTPPEATTANDANGAPDPPSLTPASGAADYLFIAFGGSSHGNTAVLTAPTNYSDNFTAHTNSSGQSTRVSIGVGTRNLNTASAEDPAAFGGGNAAAEWGAITLIVHPAAAGGLTLDAGVAGTGATVPGAEVVASGEASLDADVAGAGATVPGSEVVGSGSVPLDAGVAGVSATVPGADVSPSGSAPVDTGVAGTGATVPGSEVVPSGSAPVDVGVAGTGATIPGADVVGSGSAALDAGVAGAGATVPGAEIVSAGATIDAGVAGAGATVPGSEVVASGSAFVDAGVAGVGATVPGAEITAAGSFLDAGVAGAGATVPGSEVVPSGSAPVDAGVAGSGATVPGSEVVASGSASLDSGVAGLGATVPGASISEVATLALDAGVAIAGSTAPGAHITYLRPHRIGRNPRRNTKTGYAWPVKTTTGLTIYVYKQIVQQVPHEHILLGVDGGEWRLLDVGLVEPR